LEREVIERPDGVQRLTTLEARLLSFLAREMGRSVSQEELLEGVWGYSIDSMSRTVYTTIRRLRRKIERDPNVPEHIMTVHGEGYRLVGAEVEGEHGVVAYGSLCDSLPRPLSSFIGRSALVAQVEECLSKKPLVTLTGTAGVGKTRLALAVAQQLASEAHTVVWIELADIERPGGVIERIADALGVSAQGPQIMDSVCHAMAANEDLVIALDNAEHLTAAVGDCISKGHERAPETRWLVTSQKALGITGETRIPVPALGREDAAELLRSRAIERGAVLKDDEDDPALMEIVERLDRLPLALELAAARLPMLGADELLARLGGTLDLLRLPAGAEGRYETLRQAVEWSWHLLTPTEQSVLSQCAVFEGGFSIADAESLVRIPGSDDVLLTLDVLETLRTRSLMVVKGDLTPLRFSLLESIRAFALERLGATQLEAISRRHAEMMVNLCRPLREGLNGPGRSRSHHLLNLERGNLTAAWRWAGDSAPKLSMELVRCLHPVWLLGTRVAVHVAALEDAADQAAKLKDLNAQTELLINLADTLYYRSELQRARQTVEMIRPLVDDTTDPILVARFCIIEGNIQGLMDQPDKSFDGYTEGLKIATECEALSLQYRAHFCLGRYHEIYRGDRATAAQHYEQGMERATIQEDSIGQARMLEAMASLANQAGETIQAERQLNQAEALLAGTSHFDELASLSNSRSTLERISGRPHDALPLAEKACTLAAQAGKPLDSAIYRLNHLQLLIEVNRLDEVWPLAQTTRHEMRSAEAQWGLAAVDILEGIAHSCDKGYERAEEKLRGVQEQAHENWRPKVLGMASLYRGVVSLFTGNFEAASTFLKTAVKQLGGSLHSNLFAAQCWLAMAEAMTGDDTKALARIESVEDLPFLKVNPVQRTMLQAVRTGAQGGRPVIPAAHAALSLDLRLLRDLVSQDNTELKS